MDDSLKRGGICGICRRIPWVVVAVVVVVGVLCFFAGGLGQKESSWLGTKKPDTPDTAPRMERLKANQNFEVDAQNDRVLYVKGANESCNSPHCENSSTDVYPQRDPVGTPYDCTKPKMFDKTKLNETGETPAVGCNASSKLTYSDIYNLKGSRKCDGFTIFSSTKRCWMFHLAKLYEPPFCDGGNISSTPDNKSLTCKCPIGKGGDRCQITLLLDTTIPCNCHKGVKLCEDSLPQCKNVSFKEPNVTHCQTRTENDGSFSSCYCNNTQKYDPGPSNERHSSGVCSHPVSFAFVTTITVVAMLLPKVPYGDT